MLVSNFYDQGYYIQEDFWSRNDCDRLIQVSKTFPSWKGRTYKSLMQPHRFHQVFAEAMKKPEMVETMEYFCGGRVSGLQSVWYYGSPGSPGFPAHQDNWFVEAPPDSFVSAWSPMQDTNISMGGITGYAKSHLHGLLPVKEVDGVISEEAILPEGSERTDLFIPKGAVLFMHGFFVHESHPNVTDEFRRALLLTYIRKGEPFRPGNTAHRVEIDVY